MTGSMQRYLDTAVEVLKRYNILGTQQEESRLAGLLQQVVTVDEAKVMAIARTVQYMGDFNQLVRDNVEACVVDDRYNDISKLFDSIREDSKALIAQLDDGKIDAKEKMANWWMKVSRGTPHKRFNKIRGLYLDVTDDTKKSVEREDEILSAYVNFRMAIKQAEGIAYELLAAQEGIKGNSQQAYAAAVDIVKNFTGTDQAEKSGLELARDEALLAFQTEDRKYQLVKDVAETLTVGYNVGDTLVAKLQQVHDLKFQVYTKAITFFTTNEHVFTTMDAVYTSEHGLHEAAQSVEAMKEGINKGLEDIAELGGKVEEAAVRTAYGETLNPASVKKLVDSIVEFQTNQVKWAAESREKATASTKEISGIVEDGKQRLRAAYDSYANPNPASDQ